MQLLVNSPLLKHLELFFEFLWLFMAPETQFNFRKHKSDLRKLSLVIFITIDVLYAGVLAVSFGKVCDTPLKAWLAGAILLVRNLNNK